MALKSAKIEFVEFHRPPLHDGTYSVVVEQSIRTTKSQKIVPAKPISKTSHTFEVKGPEFSLPPQDLYAVFPPAGSLGEHSNVLPHISLRRSTLPWERIGDISNKESPWLALLVFHENDRFGGVVKKSAFVKKFANGEPLWRYLHGTVHWLDDLDGGRSHVRAPKARGLSELGAAYTEQTKEVEAFLDKSRGPRVVSLSDLEKKSAQKSICWPGIKLPPKTEQHSRVSIIDIPVALMRDIAPSMSTIRNLTHVRQEILFVTKDPLGTSLSKLTLGAKTEAAFAANGLTFGRGTTVKIQEKNKRWLIEDAANKRGFVVRKDQDEYHITDASRDELAVVIANRLPLAGGTTTVHLVSIANRYNNGSFNYDGVSNSGSVRLVSLKSWQFSCVDDKKSFKGLLMHLNHQLVAQVDGWSAKNPLDWQKQRREIIGDLNARKIPKILTQRFYEQKRTLSDENEIEICRSKISDSHTTYFVGDKNNVYDAAGKKLFSLSSVAANATHISPHLRQEFSNRGYPFLDQKNPAKPKKPVRLSQQQGRWWIHSEGAVIYITSTKDTIDAFVIDPDDSATLRLPANGNKTSAPYLASGYLPLPHNLRQGGSTYSWYHGPLAPAVVKDVNHDALPARTSDELLRYDLKNGMIDSSYAAAWELGRMLALKNTGFSTELFKWKRSHRQTFRKIEDALLHSHPHHIGEDSITLPEMPEDLHSWFTKVGELRGVPFPYLVPDERMLPPESIRFFQVDPFWTACLQDGAFSVGRVLHGDHAHDKKHPAVEVSTTKLSGFLLRSEVVSGWPGLLVDGFDILPTELKMKDPLADPKRQQLPDGNLCKLVRIDRLSQNVLLCLFDGVVKTTDIHLKPETLHFGFETAEHPGTFQKELRDANGEETDMVATNIDINESGVVNIDALVVQIKSQVTLAGKFTSAQLALELSEGVERVRFIKKNE